MKTLRGKSGAPSRRAAYTIVEALVAAGILVMGIGAAAALAITMVAQEEANARVARALNLQEQAGRLYHLGLTPAEIAAILPPEPNVSSLTFTESVISVTNVGTMESAACRIIFDGGIPVTDPDGVGAAQRTNDVVLVRPVIR